MTQAQALTPGDPVTKVILTNVVDGAIVAAQK